MDTEQTMLSQDEKKWDHVWTTDEIRKNSANWTLAGDVGLFNLLNDFAQNFISRTHEVQNAVDSLVHNTKMASVKINNVINDFHMLSNLQFVENRVYDEEVQDSVPETKPPEKTKEQREAEMLPKIIRAVELGMSVLDTAFNKINVNEISDSDDEDLSSEGRVVFEPKNPYEHRPLPYIIGSEEFMADDYAGLKDLIREDAETSQEVESSSSESDETSSDEEELPLDEDFSAVPSPRKEIQSTTDRYSSSSEESELFGEEKEDNDFFTNATAASTTNEEKINQKPSEETEVEQKEDRPRSISKLKLPQVLPVAKPQTQKKKGIDDLFAKDMDASDDESPFRKKTGLFNSDVRFDDDKDMFDDDLFGAKPKETAKKVEAPKSSPVANIPAAVKTTKEPDLFGDDEDSDDDIFNKLSKVKKPTIPKESLVFKQESPDSSSTPSSAPSIKASGDTFNFLSTGPAQTDPLFGDDSDVDDLFSSKKPVTKKFDFAADDEDEDDLFGLTTEKKTKKPEVPEIKKPEANKSSSLFESTGGTEKSYKKLGMPLPGLTTKKPKDSIFDTDSDAEQTDKKTVVSALKIATEKTKSPLNLFDDDDEEDDIFSQKPKLFSPGKSPSMKNKPEDSIPNVIQKEEIKKEAPVEKKVPSLFDDFNQDDNSILSVTTKKKADTSLFEESDSFDLFKPKSVEKVEKTKAVEKPPAKITPVKIPEPSSRPSLFSSSDDTDGELIPKVEKRQTPLFSTPDQIDGTKSSKPKATNATAALDSSDGQLDFDTPIDTSKTLNSLSKDRAKISTKRRKPTRRGRLAAIENQDTDSTTVTSNTKTPTAKAAVTPVTKSSTTDSAEDLFSSEEPEAIPATKPASVHKAQEKSKMDLMSQLMSEAASSKIGKKPPIVKEKEEDVVDIFAEMGGRNDKSQSFSFKSPIESSSKASFLEDDKDEDKGVPSGLTSEDTDNDDFFAEPSFRNFSSSISKKESILDMDDDDDDLFSIKPSTITKAKVDTSETDIFADESDIFADIPKEKYEMFPSQLYDDEDDDIFSNLDQSTSKSDKTAAKVTSTVTVKKEEKKVIKEAEKKPAFEDPLTGLLGD